MIEYFWLIPLLPLAGAVVNGLAGSRFIRSQTAIGAIACGVMLAAFVVGLGSFVDLASLPAGQRHVEVELYEWIDAGVMHTDTGTPRFSVPFGLRLDELSALMVLIVTGVGFLIHVYAIGYMQHDPPDPGFARFFTYLNLFAGLMLILVLGNSYAMMFIGWEGVGLCSYLLIGYYYWKKSAGDAAKKAFVVNRIGDAGFLLGMFTLLAAFGSLRYEDVFHAAEGLEPGTAMITFATLMLFVGAVGKSAQIPLYVWLPDAMEGPTPVSALIHAATMVTAGVYMVARSSVLFSLAPATLTVVAVIGAATALMAASIAMVQNDIKRVLAYSTVSQLGYMVLACGVGAYAVGVFHLMTHAFFKALLFLAAGSVMHALHGELDMWKMGNLRRHMPVTYRTFLIGTLAIAGVPGLAGFFSKDEVLWSAWSGPHGSPWLWAVGTLVAGMTAFYMTRMLLVTFHGESRMDPHTEKHVHENAAVMTLPLVVLAVLSILGGYVGIPANLRIGPLAWLHEHVDVGSWLAGSIGGHAEVAHGAGHGIGLEWALMLASVTVALSGIGLAWLIYGRRPQLAGELQQRFAGLYRTLWNKYWVDETYDALVVNRVKDMGTALGVFDDAIVDGVVNGTAAATLQGATASKEFDERVVDGAVNGVGNGLWSGSWFARALQTGFVQNYALVMALGVFVLVSAWLLW